MSFFSKKATPQQWAYNIQKLPSNHSSVIAQQLPNQWILEAFGVRHYSVCSAHVGFYWTTSINVPLPPLPQPLMQVFNESCTSAFDDKEYYSPASDIWSFGGVCLHLAMGFCCPRRQYQVREGGGEDLVWGSRGRRRERVDTRWREGWHRRTMWWVGGW